MVDKTKKKSVIGTLSVITEDSESNESGSQKNGRARGSKEADNKQVPRKVKVPTVTVGSNNTKGDQKCEEGNKML